MRRDPLSNPPDPRIVVNSLVQIDPAHDPIFGACFLVVTELKSWGVQGFVAMPHHPRSVQAFYRVPFDKIAYVGMCEWIHEPEQESADV